ncbi:MAG: lipopolysaccharide biosynthesis protein [Mediterranea sp.]|jgi:hypothetical protein|nr:lipopolysaccharide biosynthesis protein [Mediterranea sp.]
MKDSLSYKLHSGKPPKFLYFVKNIVGLAVPSIYYRLLLKRRMKELEHHPQKSYIESRVNYYNRLSVPTTLPSDNRSNLHFGYLEYLGAIGNYRFSLFHKAYYFDAHDYTRWFRPTLRWGYLPGDVYFTPSYPMVVKSRLLTDNTNSVVMKLDKFRHFMFVDDPIPFTKKRDMAIFRGKVRKSRSRADFLHKYFGSPLVDCGVVGRDEGVLDEWLTPKITINQHFQYKFIMTLEGNDVASNLKWVMSSNSIAVMPRPTCETWFMEGTLIPNYHYIEIKPDFSDLEERLHYYMEHTDEALRIVEHAHEYVAQFRNHRHEELISLLVLDKYFRMTGQKVC